MTVLIENVDRRVADKCISGLFNVCGGIEARRTIISAVDTDFKYSVYTGKKLSFQRIEQAIAFCKGVNYGCD